MQPSAYTIGVSEFTTWPWTFERDVERYPQHGIDAIEITEFKLDPHRYAEQLALIPAARLGVSSVQALIHALYPTKLQPEPTAPADRVRHIRNSIERIAPHVPTGTPFVVITGAPPGGDVRDVLATAAEEFGELARFAEAHGVRVALEPLNPTLMNVDSSVWSLGDALRIVDQVNHPAFGVCVDTWNIWQSPNLLETCARRRRSDLRRPGERLGSARANTTIGSSRVTVSCRSCRSSTRSRAAASPDRTSSRSFRASRSPGRCGAPTSTRCSSEAFSASTRSGTPPRRCGAPRTNTKERSAHARAVGDLRPEPTRLHELPAVPRPEPAAGRDPTVLHAGGARRQQRDRRDQHAHRDALRRAVSFLRRRAHDRPDSARHVRRTGDDRRSAREDGRRADRTGRSAIGRDVDRTGRHRSAQHGLGPQARADARILDGMAVSERRRRGVSCSSAA